MSNDEDIESEFEGTQQLRKKPYIEKSIAELSSSGKYRIVGTVTEIRDGSFIIQDGSGEIEVYLESTFIELNEEDQIRVLGYAEFEPERKFKAKLIHHLKGINLEQYNLVKEMEKSLKRKS